MKSQQVIFFCGPDRCGKTEMIKALSKRLNIASYKASDERLAFVSNQGKFINNIRFACPARLDLLKQLGSSVIYDRGYPCEWVYSRLYKRETDDAAVQWLDEQYAQMGAIIVMPFRSSYEGIVDDLDPTIGKQKLEELQALYDEFAKLTKCRVLKLNVDDENLERELDDIIKFLNS